LAFAQIGLVQTPTSVASVYTLVTKPPALPVGRLDVRLHAWAVADVDDPALVDRSDVDDPALVDLAHVAVVPRPVEDHPNRGWL
jgi:hypothetical protein